MARPLMASSEGAGLSELGGLELRINSQLARLEAAVQQVSEDVRALSAKPPDSRTTSKGSPVQLHVGGHPVQRQATFAAGAGGGWPAEDVVVEPLTRTASGLSSPTTTSSGDVVARPSTLGGSSDPDAEDERVPRYMLHPDSKVRVLFDLISVLALVYDAFMVPFTLAWNPEPTAVLLGGAVVTAFVWTADMALSFVTGFFCEGGLEMRPQAVSRRYLRGYFAYDFTVNAIDWVGVTAMMAEAQLRGAKNLVVLRVLKLQRLVRIFAVLRSGGVLERLRKLRSFERLAASGGIHMQLVLQVLRLSFLILWLNHVLCCAWYAIGTLTASDTGASWLGIRYPSDESYAEQGVLFQYTTALHWAMAQMTPGSMDVNPKNSAERLLSVFCIMFGLLFGTSIISQLSAKMVQMQMQHQEAARQTTLLRRFLHQQDIPALLASRVERAVVDRKAAPTRIKDKDIPGLATLPTYLKAELAMHTFGGRLLRHPVLRMFHCCEHGGRVVAALCSASTFTYMADGDHLFEAQTDCSNAYVAAKGQLTYSMGDRDTISVPSGTWICEAALWIEWTTVGSLEAHDQCELVCLERSSLAETWRRHRNVRHLAQQYRYAYATMAGHLPEEELTDIGLLDNGEAMMLMPKRTRVGISECVHSALFQSSWLTTLRPQSYKNLQDEITRGGCMLSFDEQGSPIRVIHVAIVRVVQHGLVLAQLAKLKGGAVLPDCQLPATRVLDGENHADAARRLLSSNLAPFTSARLPSLLHKGTTSKPSASFSVQTRYIRKIFSVTPEVPNGAAEPVFAPARRLPNVASLSHQSTNSSSEASVGRRVRIFSSESNSKTVNVTLRPTVYFMPTGEDAGIFFSWMQPEDFDRLGSEEGSRELTFWTSHFDAELSEPLPERGDLETGCRCGGAGDCAASGKSPPRDKDGKASRGEEEDDVIQM